MKYLQIRKQATLLELYQKDWKKQMGQFEHLLIIIMDWNNPVCSTSRFTMILEFKKPHIDHL